MANYRKSYQSYLDYYEKNSRLNLMDEKLTYESFVEVRDAVKAENIKELTLQGKNVQNATRNIARQIAAAQKEYTGIQARRFKKAVNEALNTIELDIDYYTKAQEKADATKDEIESAIEKIKDLESYRGDLHEIQKNTIKKTKIKRITDIFKLLYPQDPDKKKENYLYAFESYKDPEKRGFGEKNEDV